MRIFTKMNVDGNDVCPICKTKEEKEVCLVGIDGTKEGNIMQAIQIHIECLELQIRKCDDGSMIIYQAIIE